MNINVLDNKLCYESLKVVTDLLIKHEVKYWLDSGTLLGIVRQGDFIDWDWDIDLSATMIPMAKIADLKLSFKKAGFTVRYTKACCSMRLEPVKKYWGWRHIDIHFFERKEDVYQTYFHEFKQASKIDYWLKKSVFAMDFLERTIGKSAPSRRQVFALSLDKKKKPSRAGMFDDFFALILRSAKDWLYGLRLKFFCKQVLVVVPEHYFTTLDKLSIHGREYSVPTNRLGYLAYKYGDQWRTPQKDYHWHDDGSVRV